MKLSQSETAVLAYVARDGYFTTDPGRRVRENNAAHSLVRKGVCKVIARGAVWNETRRSIKGGGIETSRTLYSTIRIALN